MATRVKGLHFLSLPWTKQKMSEKRKRERNFISNGGLLQEELISICHGKNLPIHVYSAKEVTTMSLFTHLEICGESAHYILYRGSMENRLIYIKKFHKLFDYVGMTGIIREIVIATQMGLHRNSLKLLGCCLETEFPVLIYEFPEKGCLADHIEGKRQGELHWKTRLQIGYEIAYAISYLQNGFHRPVIHRNLSAKDVFLDENYVAKLSGYDFSLSIPEGEEHLMDAIVGTQGYSAPEYVASGRLTKKTDVYLFGALFVTVLRSRRWTDSSDHCRDGRLNEVLDEAILREVEENGKQQEVLEVLDLISKCLAKEEDDRPDIVDVTIGLKKFLGS